MAWTPWGMYINIDTKYNRTERYHKQRESEILPIHQWNIMRIKSCKLIDYHTIKWSEIYIYISILYIQPIYPFHRSRFVLESFPLPLGLSPRARGAIGVAAAAAAGVAGRGSRRSPAQHRWALTCALGGWAAHNKGTSRGICNSEYY